MQGANLKRFITIIQIDGSQKQLSDEDLPISIGSSTGADILIPESDSIGAYIGDSQGHLFIQPSGTHSLPLFHNNRHLFESTWLKSNDKIQCSNTLISYQKKGDKLLFTVSEQNTEQLQHHSLHPPLEPPPGNNHTPDTAGSIPIHIDNGQPFSNGKKLLIALLGSTFVLLGLAVLFVLIARPLEIDINPEPDSLSLKGFPPVLKLGGRYLCIPGTYSADIQKQGYYPVEMEIIIKKNQHNRLSATLDKLPGFLNLAVTPEGNISVYANDTLIGTTPPDTMEILPGTHQLKLIKDRYKPFISELTVEGEGKTQTLEAVLQPDWAEITITSTPPGAGINVGDTARGTTPLTMELLSGLHLVTLSKEQYVDAEVEIPVTAGKEMTHDVQLELQPGVLTLNTVPAGAAVTVDTVYHGTTPLTLPVSSRTGHQVLLSSPGYKSYQQQIDLEPAEAATLDIRLKQEQGVIFLTTHPPNASLTINGKRYGNNQGKLTLPATKQVLEVKASGYKPTTRTVLPKIGFSQQISIELLPVNNTPGSPAKAPPPLILQTSAGQKLLTVRPSTFTMGAPRREPGRRANERERTVIMKRSFYLSEKPVTNQEYRRFDKSHNSGAISNNTINDDNQPVVNLSWEEAVKYLNWLSSKDNLQPFYTAQGNSFIAASPPTNGYRLPTEAEWSFAARHLGIQTTQRFPWGDTFPPRQPSGNYGDKAAAGIIPRIIQGYNDGFPTTSPVGSFSANKGGFYDMGGNVGEWCHDYYSAYTSTLSNKPDPMGPDSGSHRVIRGASWRDATITELRLSYRAYHREARDNVGFRIARYK